MDIYGVYGNLSSVTMGELYTSFSLIRDIRHRHSGHFYITSN